MFGRVSLIAASRVERIGVANSRYIFRDTLKVFDKQLRIFDTDAQHFNFDPKLLQNVVS